MDGIELRGTMIIPKENLDAFKELAAEAMKIAASEDGVQRYDWFFNADESQCVVIERYVSSDAALDHMKAVAPLGARIGAVLGGGGFEAFGDLSPDLLDALAALNATVYTFFQGK